MPNVLQTPNLSKATNYPPELARQLKALFDNGLPTWLALAFDFNTADAATLFTVPSGYRLFVHRTLWEIDVAMTGGTSSTIGLSSDAAGYTTKGSLQGAAGGDAAAALTAGLRPGALGSAFGSNGVVVLPAASVVRFDRIVSAFTAGNGRALLQVSALPTS